MTYQKGDLVTTRSGLRNHIVKIVSQGRLDDNYVQVWCGVEGDSVLDVAWFPMAKGLPTCKKCLRKAAREDQNVHPAT